MSRYNRGAKFILTCIDVFSKKAWVVPFKDKMGTTLVNAFESICHPLPKMMQMDKGTEFLNRKFQQWVNVKDIVWSFMWSFCCFSWLVSYYGPSDEKGGNVLWGWLLAWYKCQHDDFVLSVMENGNGGGRTWCCSGSWVPKAEIVYLCQVLLILSIILASIYNLSNQQGDQQLWVALLSSCMGYLLPSPSLKSWVTFIWSCRVIPPWITTRETVWRILPPSYPMPSIWLGTGRLAWRKSSILTTGITYLQKSLVAHVGCAVAQLTVKMDRRPGMTSWFQLAIITEFRLC